MLKAEDVKRFFKGFFEKFLIAIIVAIFNPIIAVVNAWSTRKSAGLSMPMASIALVAGVVLATTVLFALLFRKKIFVPMKNSLPAGRQRPLKVSAWLIIILYFMFTALGMRAYTEYSIAQETSRPSRIAERLIKRVSDEFLLRSSDAREVLRDAAITINNSAKVRAEVVDTCYRLSSMAVDIGWCGPNAFLETSFRGKFVGSEELTSARSRTFKVFHWADVPVGLLRKHVKVYDLDKGREFEISFEKRTDEHRGSPVSTYYIGRIRGITGDVALIEKLEWPCALWREPDAVVVDCDRFRAGIDSALVDIYTDNGAVYVAVYRFVIGKGLYVDDVQLHSCYELTKGEIPVDKKRELYWSQKGMRWHVQTTIGQPKGIYVFIIFRRDIVRPLEGRYS